MGVEIKGTKDMGREVERFLDRAIGIEQANLGKATVESATRISPTEYWAEGEYATGEYQNSWGMTKSGKTTTVGNTSKHANVIEFGAGPQSKRRSGMALAEGQGFDLIGGKRSRREWARLHKQGKRKKYRVVNLAPQKVLARAITMGFDATERARKKRQSLDGKPLK